MPDHLDPRPGSRRVRLTVWAERLLVGAGAAALIWCALIVSDAVIAQRLARNSLILPVRAGMPVAPPLPAAARDVPSPPPLVARGSPIGAISIPRVDLSAVVLHGSDAHTLRRGPGHLENSALPGHSGNVVIAGHRDSFFWPLRNIQLGDHIFLETSSGRFHYRVASIRVVEPRDVSVLASTAEPMLTLITCYPFWVFGNAPDRLVVRATAVGGAARAVAADHPAARGSAETAESADSAVTVPHDDTVLVRQAVERYRVAYNGRLVSRHEVGVAKLSAFATCDVTVAGDRATAACEPARSASSAPAATGRTFLLERAAGRWAITSIVVN